MSKNTKVKQGVPVFNPAYRYIYMLPITSHWKRLEQTIARWPTTSSTELGGWTGVRRGDPDQTGGGEPWAGPGTEQTDRGQTSPKVELEVDGEGEFTQEAELEANADVGN